MRQGYEPAGGVERGKKTFDERDMKLSLLESDPFTRAYTIDFLRGTQMSDPRLPFGPLSE